MIKKISYIWESLCSFENAFTFFLTSDFTLILQDMYYTYSFTGDRPGAQRLITSLKSHSDDWQTLIHMYIWCLSIYKSSLYLLEKNYKIEKS